MNIYGELDPMPEQRKQFVFKGKREHVAEVNIPNLTHPNQHIDIEMPHGSRDCARYCQNYVQSGHRVNIQNT